MISPGLGRRVLSSISSNSSNIGFFSSVITFWLILEITSLIIHAGVDAPAVIPILLYLAVSFNSNSEISLIKTAFLQCFFAISYSFLEFELWGSPITTIRSDFSARSAHASCLSLVALHMVF